MAGTSDENARELVRREDKLFGQKQNLDSLNQELALNFYPERADFTTERALGEEFAIDLFDSTPLLCRRDLGNARAAMLRPRGQQWFRASLGDDAQDEQPQMAQFLDQINKRARQTMYRANTGYVRAEKEADHDLVTFGMSVKSFEATLTDAGTRQLLACCWHLRDCAWLDDKDGTGQDLMFRRFKASARHIKKMFPDATLHADIVKALEKDPDREFKLCHTMMLADEYEYQQKPKRTARYVSVYYDSAHKMLLRERPSDRFRYVVDRWATISGSQYAYSPASMTGLADARGMQTMARVLLEAGEKALDPPVVATQKALKSEVNTYAGGITWVDEKYDEKLGPSIRPLFPPNQKPELGVELIMRSMQMQKDTWYLTKLTLPQQAKTAYETAQLVEEFIRSNIPLFEPWEAGTELDLDEIFAVLIDIGSFGPMQNWPKELSGANLGFAFSNPLQDAIEKNKVNQYQTALGLAAGVAQIAPDAVRRVDWAEGLVDAVRGAGAPADWIVDEEQAQAQADAAANAQKIVGAINVAGQAADVANTGLDAAAKLKDLTRPNVSGEGAYGPT